MKQSIACWCVHNNKNIMLSEGNPCCFGCNAVWFIWFPWPFSSSHRSNVYHKGGLNVGSGPSKDRLITRAVMVFPVLIWQSGWSLPCRLKIPQYVSTVPSSYLLHNRCSVSICNRCSVNICWRNEHKYTKRQCHERENGVCISLIVNPSTQPATE